MHTQELENSLILPFTLVKDDSRYKNVNTLAQSPALDPEIAFKFYKNTRCRRFLHQSQQISLLFIRAQRKRYQRDQFSRIH